GRRDDVLAADPALQVTPGHWVAIVSAACTAPSCRTAHSHKPRDRTNKSIVRTRVACEHHRVKSVERQRVIVERLRDADQVGVAELAEATGASEMTVRRDLDHLASRGVLRRVHGGAVPASPSGIEPPFAARATAALAAKRSIAVAAAELIRDGETIVLDSGTTALELARLLRGRTITVMPLSLHAARELADAPGVRL